jgi:hypothetical protein
MLEAQLEVLWDIQGQPAEGYADTIPGPFGWYTSLNSERFFVLILDFIRAQASHRRPFCTTVPPRHIKSSPLSSVVPPLIITLVDNGNLKPLRLAR